MELKELKIGELIARIPVIQGGMGVGVSLHKLAGAGLPVSLPEMVGAAKTKLAPIVSSLKSVQVICKYWKKKYDREPEMVVVEGPKAGGHLGFSMEQLTGKEPLDFDAEIRNITEYVHDLGKQSGKQIPVVVAGGIYTREDAEKAEYVHDIMQEFA